MGIEFEQTYKQKTWKDGQKTIQGCPGEDCPDLFFCFYLDQNAAAALVIFDYEAVRHFRQFVLAVGFDDQVVFAHTFLLGDEKHSSNGNAGFFQ